MGIVVFRSTTPWVAESSRSNSDLLTVISIVAVPTADAIASTGINPNPCGAYLEYFLISNQKPIKPAVTVGLSEKWKINPSLIFAPLQRMVLMSKIRPAQILNFGRFGPDPEFLPYFP